MKDNIPVSMDDSLEQSAGSGARSLAGYDYQVDVSIWLALDLMLGSGLAEVVELEPGSEEDLEAELADDEPGRVATRVGMNGYILVVQVKLRGGDAWTVGGLNSLLKHGSNTRPSAKKRLADSNVRYLLVTSAALNGEARKLSVKHAGSWPRKDQMPSSMLNMLQSDAGGRVAVIGNIDEERLIQEIKRLLIERFGVPNSRWIECLHMLRSEALLRVRRAGQGRWHREDLAQAIRKHDGYLASSPQLENYIYPQNWHSLRNAMGSPKFAAIIIGQSGTGKTLATSKIYEELRCKNPGLTRVFIRNGPQELRNDRTLPPVLYDIEDPWGRYDFEHASRPWNDELAQLLSKARADRMIIATSRRDVARSSHALDSVTSWIVPLEAEHYGKYERQELYRTRIDALPRDIHLLAANAEQQVLDKLATPLEIEKFFDALCIMERPKQNNSYAFITSAIAKAHEQSIESTVIQQIEHRKDICAATVIWAFLKLNERLSIQLLRDLEQELVNQIPAFEKGITPLIDFFIAARNLRSANGYVSYYHPRVEAGVERALKNNAFPVSRTLHVLLDVLTDSEEIVGGWGVEFAARILVAAKKLSELTLKLSQKTVDKIDFWVSACLADPAKKLSEYMSLAAIAGSPASNPAELARYFLNRPDKRFGYFHLWEPPNHPDTWYKRLRMDPATTNIAGRFIREMLPDDINCDNKTFVDYLDRMASDLTPAYLDAAAAIVCYGYTPSSDVIATGALRDLDGFESIVDSAIKELTLSIEDQARRDETRLAIINKEYNEDYIDHMADNDDGYTANEFLQMYADRVREVRGWKKLTQHQHSVFLCQYWMKSLMNEAKIKPPSGEEIADAWTAAFDSKEEEKLWLVLALHWDGQYEHQLLSRVFDGSPLSEVRYAALLCLVKQLPDLLLLIVEELQQREENERIIELIVDLAYLQDRQIGVDDNYSDVANAAMNRLPPVFRELCEAARSHTDYKSQPLSSGVIVLLNKSTQSSLAVRKLRIRHHLELSGSVGTDIKWMLAHSDDPHACVEAIDAAIALGMDDIITEALAHRFADVVAKALTIVGSRFLTPLPADLLALAEAKGSPVRKALVNLLAARPYPVYLPVLLRLVQDQWSSSSRYNGEDDNFLIARSAVKAIYHLSSIDNAILEQLQEIAFKTSDHLIRENIFRIIAVHGGYTFQEQLFELATKPGRMHVKDEAARAMLAEVELLDLTVVDKITADILTTQDPSIAAILTLIAACRSSLSECLEIARGISANSKRRALILLMLWPEITPYESSRSAIRQLLPNGHASLEWVNAGPSECAEDILIADLGEPAICKEVLRWLNPNVSES